MVQDWCKTGIKDLVGGKTGILVVARLVLRTWYGILDAFEIHTYLEESYHTGDWNGDRRCVHGW